MLRQNEEKDFLILVIMLLIVCVLALKIIEPEHQERDSMPLVGVVQEGDEFATSASIMGCDWTYKTKGFTEKIPYTVDFEFITEFESSNPVNTQVYIEYEEEPTDIKIKVFPYDDRKDYSKGILISTDREFLYCPGYTYAIELEFGDNKIMYAFSCVKPS